MPAPSPRPHRRPRPSRALAALALIAVLGVASGCATQDVPPINRTKPSGSATATVVNGVQQVTIDAGDDYRFSPSTITVHQGLLRVVLRHTGVGAPHNFEVPAAPRDYVPLVSAGQTHAATFTTPSPGRYEFVCTIHVQQGQVGTMIVTAGH